MRWFLLKIRCRLPDCGIGVRGRWCRFLLKACFLPQRGIRARSKRGLCHNRLELRLARFVDFSGLLLKRRVFPERIVARSGRGRSLCYNDWN